MMAFLKTSNAINEDIFGNNVTNEWIIDHNYDTKAWFWKMNYLLNIDTSFDIILIKKKDEWNL